MTSLLYLKLTRYLMISRIFSFKFTLDMNGSEIFIYMSTIHFCAKIKDHIDLNVTAIMWSIRVVFPLLCVDSTCCKVKTSTMPLEWLFGRKKTPEEMLRQNQRALNKAMRDLDRERAKMEQQEKKVIADIKNMAKKGQMVCRTVCPKWNTCTECHS